MESLDPVESLDADADADADALRSAARATAGHRSRTVPGVELQLEPGGDAAVLDAARRAAARAGVLPAGRPGGGRPWWRAGIAESVEGRVVPPPAPGYDVVPSPRSTRGASRA